MSGDAARVLPERFVLRGYRHLTTVWLADRPQLDPDSVTMLANPTEATLRGLCTPSGVGVALVTLPGPVDERVDALFAHLIAHGAVRLPQSWRPGD